MMRATRWGRSIVLAAALLGVGAPGAQAAFHLMKVSEVFPGTSVDVNTAFVELQMYEPGQNLVGGHKIDYYTASGTLLGSYTIPGNVPNAESQRRILIGDTAAGGSPDFVFDQLGDALHSATAGGALCFPDAQPPDCVSWGNFTGAAALPGATGMPVPGGIPEGFSLSRVIARGCPDLLEASDDTDNSAADFGPTSPTPQNNSAPVATQCGSGGPDTEPPETKIDKAPKGTIEKDTAKIKFSSDEAGSTFECKLDKGAYKSCRSPRKYKNLDDGKHKVLVRATDGAGNTDPTPDKAKFKVDTG